MTIPVSSLSSSTFKMTAQLLKSGKVAAKDTDTFKYMPYTVTLHDTNDVSGVDIQVYRDADLTATAGALQTTDATGVATLTLTRGTYYYQAAKVGYEDCTGSFTVLRSDVYEDFTIPFLYTVTLHEQNSLEGVSVQVYRAAGSTDPVGTALMTNASGDAITSLSNGSYYIRASLDRYDNYFSASPYTVSNADTTFSFGMVLENHTITFQEQNNLSGVAIQFYSDGTYTTPMAISGVTDSSGSSIFQDMPHGYFWWEATRSAYEVYRDYISIDGDSQKNFALVPINHKVTLQEYSNLSGVAIQFYSDGTYTTPTGFMAVTDSSGSAIIQDVPHGSYWWRASLSDYETYSGYFELEGDYSYTFELLPSNPVTYTVTFIETASTAGIQVKIYGERFYNDSFYRSAITDENGVATADLPAGDYWFEGSALGFNDTDSIDFTVTGPGLQNEFTMMDAGEDYLFTFTETNATADVTIQVYSLTYTFVTTLTTDASGEAIIALPAGDYRFGANKSGYDTFVGVFTTTTTPAALSFTLEPSAAPAALPYYEGFDYSPMPEFPPGWRTNYPSNWSLESSSYAGGSGPELRLYWEPWYQDAFMAISPAIDATTASGLQLTFKEKVDWYSVQIDLQVRVSTDGGNTWDDPVWSISPTNQVGPHTVTVDLSAYDGQTINIAWVLQGDSYNINYWYIDDINVIDNSTAVAGYAELPVIQKNEPVKNEPLKNEAVKNETVKNEAVKNKPEKLPKQTKQ